MSEIVISPRTVRRTLFLIAGFLFVMHTLVMVGKIGFGHDYMKGLTPLFDLDLEQNVPTWYSSTVHLVSALALGIVAAVKRQQRAPFARRWMALSFVFVYLSIDEVSTIHEQWGVLLAEPLATWRMGEVYGGLFRNVWVLPAGLIASIVGLSFWRFLRHLPRETRSLFVLAGVLFVLGAVGMEMAGARYSALGGGQTAGYVLLATIEEILEISSIVLFLYAVLRYAARDLSTVGLHIGETH